MKTERQAKMESKEMLSSKIKEYIKWVICKATIFLLFELHLDSQSFKTVAKLICPILLLSYSLAGDDVKRTLKLLVIVHLPFLLFINNHRWPEHVIPWAGRDFYWWKFYLDYQGCQSFSHQVIQIMCAMFGDYHMFKKLLCSFCTEIYMSTLNFLAR